MLRDSDDSGDDVTVWEDDSLTDALSDMEGASLECDSEPVTSTDGVAVSVCVGDWEGDG